MKNTGLRPHLKRGRNIPAIIFFIFFTTIISQNLYGQSGWVLQYVADAELCSIDFLNAGTGICTGWNGRIFKTTNAGLTWNPLPIFTYSSDL